MSIIFMITMASMVLIMYAVFRMAATPNGNILLSRSLPVEVMNEPDVQDIVKKYKRANALLSLGALASAVPFFFVIYDSILMIYVTVWFMVLFYLYGKVLGKYCDELYALKKERGWWLANRNEICVDTEVSRLKNTFAVSQKWFLVPLAIVLVPPGVLLFSGRDDFVLWMLSLLGVGMLAVVFILVRAVVSVKSHVYSDNTEINIALNRVYKREWTRCYLIIAALQGVFNTTLVLLMYATEVLPEIVSVGVVLLIIGIAVPVYLANDKVRRERNRLLGVEHAPAFTDDDEYWSILGYNNPNDNNFWVEKRVGIGMTINMAKQSAKWFMWLTLGPAVLLMFGIAVYIMPADFGNVSLSVDGQTATVRATLQGHSFSTEDIVSVTVLETMPRATRIAGVGTGRVSAGLFTVAGHGRSHVFITNDVQSFIAVELTNGWVFLDGSSYGQTMEFYRLLSE